MNQEINLASKTVAKIRQRQRLKRLINQLIIWVGLLLSVVLIVVSLLSLLINKSNEQLQSRIKSTETKIKNLSKVESQQVYLTSKLAAFSGLIKTHELHQSVAETVFALIPSGTSIKGFNVSETGIIEISGSTPSWSLFSRLLANLNQAATQPLLVKAVKVQQVNFNAEGTISFSLELTLNI
jgi:Tfp pilus assembly protein PilN